VAASDGLRSIRDTEERGAVWQRGQNDALDASGVNCNDRRGMMRLRGQRECEECAQR